MQTLKPLISFEANLTKPKNHLKWISYTLRFFPFIPVSQLSVISPRVATGMLQGKVDRNTNERLERGKETEVTRQRKMKSRNYLTL